MCTNGFAVFARPFRNLVAVVVVVAVAVVGLLFKPLKRERTFMNG
jgi:hypothetical protein